MKKKDNIRKEAQEEYWLSLAERYFDALTDEEEELRLREFLATPEADSDKFNDIKAVMGYLSYGKKLQRAASKTTERKGAGNRRWSIAAAITAAIVLGTAWLNSNMQQDICIAYINGQKITDKEMVMSYMHHTLAQVTRGTEEFYIEKQLGNIFRTMDEYNSINNK